MRILLVEDDIAHSERLKQSLVNARGPCPRCVLPVTYEVETAESVEEARRRIQDLGYDFVLIDIEISGDLDIDQLIPMLEEKVIPYAYYSARPEDVGKTEAPVWKKVGHIRMDLITKIADHYHSFVQKKKHELNKSGRYCLGRIG